MLPDRGVGAFRRSASLATAGLVVSLVLGACAPTQTATPTKPAEAPKPTAAAPAAPAAASPAAQAAASPAAGAAAAASPAAAAKPSGSPAAAPAAAAALKPEMQNVRILMATSKDATNVMD